ncbi:MAG: regulatory protein RecX [Nitrospirae bacterium]|nr:regulatory protein RecX [Nitrospirota bacterium]
MRSQKLKGSPDKRVCKSDARNYALRLLSYRSRSRKEILQRLKEKGFSAHEIEKTVSFLQDAGFIKDEAVAQGLLHNAVDRKYLGRKGIRMLLLSRGIEKGLIDETLSVLTDDMEQEAAAKLVEKKLKNLRGYPEEIIKQKLWGMLSRRGFSSYVINAAIKSLRL